MPAVSWGEGFVGRGEQDRGDQTPVLARKLSPGLGMAAKDVAAHQLARTHSDDRLVAEHGYQPSQSW